jgi:ligand-binding sensor domain-containing protein
MLITKAIWIIFMRANATARLCILQCILLLSAGISNAQPLLFKSYTTANGLSQNSVYCITETEEGFTWFGTQDGLNRFDGSNFVRFVPHLVRNEQNTIVTAKYSRQISALCPDGKLLWVGTVNGLLLYDLVKNIFFEPKNFRTALGDEKDVWLLKIKKDKRGNIWVLTKGHGLFCYNYSKQQMQTISLPLSRKADIIAFDINDADAVWCCTNTDFYYCNNGKNFSMASVKPTVVSNKRDITDMAFVNNEIWFTSSMANTSGLLSVSNDTIQRITPLQNLFTEKIVITDARLIHQSDKNTAWIGTRSNGLYKIDLSAKTIVNANAFGNDNSLKGAFILSLFTNKQHVFWVGLSGGGVSKYDPNKFKFNLWKVLAKENNLLPDNMILSVFTQNDEDFYMGTLTSGLLQLKKSTGNFTYHNPAAYSLPAETKNIYGILKGSNDLLWLATWGGLCSFDKRSAVFTNYIDEDDEQTTQLYCVLKLTAQNKLIVTSGRGGFRLFNLATKTFEKPKDVNHVLDSTALRIRHVQEMSNGDFYFATETRGLVKYNYLSGLFTFYPQFQKEYSDCRHFYFENKTGLLATTNGLLQVALNDMRVEKKWTTENGLPNNYVYSVAKDSAGNIWLSTNLGLASMSSASGIWHRYTIEDGLSALEFNTASICTTSTGSIWFGGVNGLSSINPQPIPGNTYSPKPVFTAINVMGQPLQSDTAIPYLSSLILPHSKNFISFEFQTPLFSQTESIQYQYQLTSVDTGWISNGNKNFVNYTQLKPGQYTFLVRSANSSGIWSQQFAALTVTITPPWYGTKWFSVLAVLFTTLLAIVLYNLRIKNIKSKAAVKQKIAEVKMQSLRAQMNPHFIFNSLNSIENFIMRNEKRLASDYLNKFSQLVRSILDSSLNEMVPLAKDMEALKWYVELEQLRFNNKFSYKEITDKSLLQGDYSVPSLLIQPYVENAILHGLANSDKDGLLLSVEVLLQENQLKYIISDNGVGRAKAAEYNRQNKPNHKSVGLEITEDRINLFNNTNKSTVVIADILDTNGKIAGTKVEVTLNIN